MDVVTRQQWGARPPKRRAPIIQPVEGIFVHHSVTQVGPDEAAIVRQVQAFHMDTRGWSDIAYSWLVGQSGRAYEGRGWGVTGGHTEGWNSRSHAVCWIGDSDITDPSPAALRTIKALCVESRSRYGDHTWTKPHNAVNQTACPGRALTSWLAAGMPVIPTTTQPEDDMPLTAEDLAKVRAIVADEVEKRTAPLWQQLAPRGGGPIRDLVERLINKTGA